MTVTWNETVEDLWRHHLNRLAWGAAYADSFDAGETAHAARLADEARSALIDHLNETNMHPAMLRNTDRDDLLARLIELGGQPTLQVGQDTIRRELDHLVASGRPSRWSVVLHAEPTSSDGPATEREATCVLDTLPITNTSVTALTVTHLKARFHTPVQSPAELDRTTAAVTDALVSANLIRTDTARTTLTRY